MIALCFSANEMALTSGIHCRGTAVSPLEQPQSLRRWGCSRDPHSSQHLSKHCSNVPSSKGSGFSFCAEQSQRADTDISQCFAAEVAGCWLWDNNLLLLFSLFENNNSCWGVLARGGPWLCVIYVGYVCSQQRSEREQINASPEALVLCCYRWAPVPQHFPRSSSTAGVGAAPWQSPSGTGCQLPAVCVLSPLGRTSLKSFLKEHFRISKIIVQGASLSCIWVKQNEVEKSPRFIWVYLSKLTKQWW